MSLGVSGAAHEASMLGAAAAAARNSRPLHLQGEHGGHGCSNMLYLPRCTPHWIKADPTALQSDPGDPTMSVVDLATRAVERAHRAGNVICFCWDLTSVFRALILFCLGIQVEAMG